MSVLSFPRIYFKGWLEWDPCTFNNNDFGPSPTYDGGRASLNWPFLSATGPSGGITPENFQETFRPWARTFSPTIQAVPAEWNMFGTHSVKFVQDGGGESTLVTGGATGPNGLVTSDPLIGGKITLMGDQGTPAVLVDTNPSSFWSSQIFWGSLSIGSGAAAISGTRSFRMHSRWLNLNRIYSLTSQIQQPAASVACVFQTGIPFADVKWPATGVSALADALKTAASAPGAQGIMVRFNAYVNLYFQNGVLNDIATRPCNYTELAAALEKAWAAWEASGGTDTSLFFSQPCYSHVVGVAGVWNDGELATIPGGRYLVAETAVGITGATGPTGPTGPSGPCGPTSSKMAAAHAAAMATVPEGAHAAALRLTTTPTTDSRNIPANTALGPVVAEVNQGFLSLDLNSTIPEYGYPGESPSVLTKADFGPLSVGLMLGGGSIMPLGEIGYDQYGMTAYETTAGIIDLKLPASVSGPLPDGTLVIQSQGLNALQEQILSAETDTRGIYLDEGESTTFDITVCQRGVPAPNANVVVARYGSPYQVPANYGALSIVPVGPTAPTGPTGATAPPAPAEQVVDFTNGTISNVVTGGVTTEVTTVTANGEGVATVGVSAQTPGFMVLGFFPYPAGATVPPPIASSLNPAGPSGPFNTTINNWYYTTVRVLPFDNALPQQFCDLWNSTHDQDQAWDFIYSPTSPSGGILYLYDMIFSVMLKYVQLGNRQAVESEIIPIWAQLSPPSSSEYSYLMPITRDLSAGKRLVIQLWIYLVANGYPTSPPLTVNSIDGWSPIT